MRALLGAPQLRRHQWSVSCRGVRRGRGCRARTATATRSRASARRRWALFDAHVQVTRRNANSPGVGAQARPRDDRRELLYIANVATLRSRKGKEAGAIDWDVLVRRWDATLGGDLAGIAPAASDARGPGAQAGEHHAGQAPTGPPAPEAQARALAKALVLVSGQHPAWTQHDLLKHLALVLPAETRQMSPEEARELLLGLAEEALSGRRGEAVCLEAPEWPPLPASLRRQLDDRSIYTRPGVARYATAAQLSMEERLVAHAQAQGAPHVPGELAARRLGADLAQLRAALADRAHDAREYAAPRGLRMDQAAAAWHALTSVRTVEVITSPAGTGKTRVLAAIARAWDEPVVGHRYLPERHQRVGEAGIRVAANTTRLLADLNEGRIPPGSLIVADEGSMIQHRCSMLSQTGRTRARRSPCSPTSLAATVPNNPPPRRGAET